MRYMDQVRADGEVLVEVSLDDLSTLRSALLFVAGVGSRPMAVDVLPLAGLLSDVIDGGRADLADFLGGRGCGCRGAQCCGAYCDNYPGLVDSPSL